MFSKFVVFMLNFFSLKKSMSRMLDPDDIDLILLDIDETKKKKHSRTTGLLKLNKILIMGMNLVWVIEQEKVHII